MFCPACKAENPDSKKYCGDCGSLLQKDAFAVALQQEVAKELDARLKDQKVIEVETAQAIVSRVSDWAKLFGFFAGMPLALVVVILGFLGIKTYSDFSERVNKAKEEALKPLEGIKAQAATIAQAYKDLDTQLQQNKQLAAQVQSLSDKVGKIEQAIKFKPSASLTPELKQNLTRAFGRYYAYLKNIGFPLTKNPPTAFVDPSLKEQAYYLPPANQIVLSPDFAPLSDAGLREYTFYGLGAIRPGVDTKMINTRIAGLESGLADFFPCSFTGKSEFGKEIFETIAKSDPGFRPPLRNLDNHRSFTEIDSPEAELHDAGNIWAGAFWQLRTLLGQTVTDKLLIAAWEQFPATNSFQFVTFAQELLKRDTALYGGAHTKQIQSVFEERGLKF